MLIWFSAAMLTLDALKVIDLRMRMISTGGASTEETLLMVTEKLDALAEAAGIMRGGGHPAVVIDHYRRIVRANVARLSASSSATGKTLRN